MDAQLFQQFLEFQKFKAAAEAAKKPQTYAAAAAAPAPAAPASLPRPAFSVSQDTAAFRFREKPRSISLDKIVFSCLPKMSGNVLQSKHYYLWKTFQSLIISNPERFTITSEIHGSPDSRTYFSFNYSAPHITANFHVYGEIEGIHFTIHTIDILFNSYEKYLNAVDFRRAEDDSASAFSS